MARKGRRTMGKHSLSQPSTSAQADEDESMEEEPPRARTQPQESEEDQFDAQAQADQVARLVKCLLAADCTKVPLTKSNVNKICGFQGKQLRTALASAQGIMEDIFGYHLIDLDQNRLMLCNTLSNEYFEYSDDLCGRYALLFLVLSHIFMSGEKCSQGSIIMFLTRLGIIVDGHAVHETLGDVVKLVFDEFVKEKYIEEDKPEDNKNKKVEDNEKEYKWGRRAEEELTVRTVMEFVSKVYGDKDLQSWQQQYENMIRIEQDGVQVVNGN